jgi:hypothetical protein
MIASRCLGRPLGLRAGQMRNFRLWSPGRAELIPSSQTVTAKGVNRMKSRSEEAKEKKVYSKPTVVSEQMFETAALACGKCTSGPFPQFACGSLPQAS